MASKIRTLIESLKTINSQISVNGLNADTLDGQHGYYYAPINNPTFTNNIVLSSSQQYPSLTVKSTHSSGFSIIKFADATDSGYDLSYDKVNNNLAINKTINGSYDSTLFIINSTNFQYNSNTIWHAGNDGSGSGLDADTLDGKHSSEFAAQKGTDTVYGGAKFSLSGTTLTITTT